MVIILIICQGSRLGSRYSEIMQQRVKEVKLLAG